MSISSQVTGNTCLMDVFVAPNFNSHKIVKAYNRLTLPTYTERESISNLSSADLGAVITRTKWFG